MAATRTQPGAGMAAPDVLPHILCGLVREGRAIQGLVGAPPGMLPAWDLISTCDVGGKKGVLLVEAKAHEGELDFGGKNEPRPSQSRSTDNHREIARCIDTVARAMRKHVDSKIGISIRHRYQLSNRVAWAWRLAESGGRVVLLYLGFTGDGRFPDRFVNAAHWERTMGAYMRGCLPMSLPGRRVDLDSGGSFLMLVEALAVRDSSWPI